MSLPTCQTCVYAKGICEKTGVKIRYSTGCTYHKPKRITNADRIRAMTNVELAELFSHLCCPFSLGGKVDCNAANKSCKACWLDWLKQEAQK